MMTHLSGTLAPFPTTSWNMILTSRDPMAPEHRERLDLLFRKYWKPVFAYIRAAWRKTIEDSKDLTQAFFVYLLQKRYLERLEARGSFRGYLKRALRHFLIDAHRAEQVRRPALPFFRLDASPSELARVGPASPEQGPDESYDRQWSRDLLEAAIAELQARMIRDGRGPVFDAFRLYCLKGRGTYAQVASELGTSEPVVRHALTDARAALRGILLERIREYEPSAREADVELRRMLQ